MATGIHHFDALVGIKTAIEGLGLTGLVSGEPLDPEQVYLRELSGTRNLDISDGAVVVSLAPMPEQREIADNETDQVGYVCMAVVIAPANQALDLKSGGLAWRQSIEEKFNRKQPQEVLDAMADEITLRETRWEPLDVIDLAAFQDKNLFVSAALITVVVWKPR